MFIQCTGICLVCLLRVYIVVKSFPVIFKHFSTLECRAVTMIFTPMGRFVIRQLGLATINLHTKYEVSMFTHYKDMKVDEKCKNWGGFGVRSHPRSSETSPCDRAHTTFYSPLIETIRLSCTVFEL